MKPRSTVRSAQLFAIALALGCSGPPGASSGTDAPAPPAPTAAAAHPVAVLVPARGGAVNDSTQHSDEFMWRQLVAFAAPATAGTPSPLVFETWASDADTFSTTPAWPAPEAPKRFQRSALGAATAGGHGTVDVACNTPGVDSSQGGNAAVGGFPTTGTPTPCIAEEVKRNRSQFDYVVNNGLNTKAGLAKAFAAGLQVTMPTDALSVKGDWIPVEALLQWIPALQSVENIRTQYYTNVSDGVEYAVVSLHVSSRQNPNWVWATFEHQMNPGRCDDIGCWDSFGAVDADVLPDRTAVNGQYGACQKSPALEALMAEGGLAPAWRNYCMKSTMVDYVAPDGTPYALGNSVIERIVGNGTVATSSCITCHNYAAFDETGAVPYRASAMLPYNPAGRPIPAVLEGLRQFDFMWGVILAP